MPIVEEDSLQRPVVLPDVIEVAKDVVKLNVIDTNYVPKQAILTSIEGSPWKTDYYSQVVADANGLHGQALTRDPSFQQYRLIRGLIIKVTSPLATTQDTEQKTMLVEGSATLYPGLIPNEGDMFVADIGDGRAGVFQIKHTERKTIFKDTCYTVDYVLVDYTTPERLGDLAQKVVETLYFVMDFMEYGQRPYLHTNDYQTLQQLKDRFAETLESYFIRFSHREKKTLLLPNQRTKIYDAWMTPFVTRAFTLWDVREGRSNRVLNVSDDFVLGLPSLWDALAKQDPKILKRACTRAGLVSARMFSNQPLFEGIYYSGISYVVYPIDPVISAQDVLDATKKNVNDVESVRGSGYTPGMPAWIKPVALDDYYVFSQAFYQKAEQGQSKLELAVWQYLTRQPANTSELLAMLDDSENWGDLEVFYYVPILLVLIRAAIRGF